MTEVYNKNRLQGILSYGLPSIVVGYSLPEADSEARSAMMLGFQANPDALRVIIDPSSAVQDRYAQLHGERHLMQLPGSLEDWNEHLEGIIGEELADRAG